MDPIYAYLERHDIPILIHCLGSEEVSTPEGLLDVNRKFPELKMLAGHMGGFEYERAIECAKLGNENYLLEICGTDSSVDRIKRAVDTLGSGRVLYGTDYSLHGAAQIIGKVFDADITESDRQNIFYKNAERIFARLG